MGYSKAAQVAFDYLEAVGGLVKRRAAKLAERRVAPITDLADKLCDLKEIDGRRFREHVKDLGFSQRKAYYLIKIWEQLEDEVPSERLEKIGWSKLKALLPHIKNATRRPF